MIRTEVRKQLREEKNYLQFRTWTEPPGVEGRYRVSSDVIDLPRVAIITRGVLGGVYGDELGFSKSYNRDYAIKLIQKKFDTNEYNLDDYKK